MMADFGKHFCHPSSPFRHTSIRFADFYKHFCFGLHCCLCLGIQVFDSLIFVNIFALVTYVPHERFYVKPTIICRAPIFMYFCSGHIRAPRTLLCETHNNMSCANSDDWTIKIATYSCDLY